MRRRDFVVGLGAAAALALPARAQQPRKPRRLAFVHSGIKVDKLVETGGTLWIRRFYAELRRLGYTEGVNLVVDRYSAEGRSDRFVPLAAEIVASNPDVIVSNLNALIKTFLAATATIPIVGLTSDPILGGLIASLARPGGNLTGVSVEAGPEIINKRLQIMKEAMPSVAKVAYLLANSRPNVLDSEAFQAATRQLGLELTVKLHLEVDEAQLRKSFAEMAEQRPDAILLDGSGSFLAFRALIVELAARSRIPVLYPYRDYMEQGGLIAFAPDIGELAERMASDVHQIFNGAKAGEIPFYQPNKFELIVNLKTAKALDLVLPPTLVSRADEVIE